MASFREFHRTYSEYLYTVYKPANPLSYCNITPISDLVWPYTKYGIENPFESKDVKPYFDSYFYMKPTVENFIQYLKFMQIVPVIKPCDGGFAQVTYETSIQLEPQPGDRCYDAYKLSSIEFYERDSQTFLRVNNYDSFDETILNDCERFCNIIDNCYDDFYEQFEELYEDYESAPIYISITDNFQCVNTYTDINLSTFDYSKIEFLYALPHYMV